MPATFTNSAIDATRRCPHPEHVGERELPFTNDFFYHRPNGTVDYWCRECVRRYNREQRARRQGNDRKFGVEIECIVDRDALDRELRARGLSVYNSGYTHQVMASWKIVTDASVMNGYELVSPPLKGARGLRELKKACDALDAAGATVNRSCGLHVHHEVADLTAEQFGRLFRVWANNQRGTDGLVAASRRGCNWARPLSEREVAHCEQAPIGDVDGLRRHFSYADRYRSLNVAAFPRYGTVEVRQHQGTTNYTKIAAWVAFGQAFITWAKGNAALTVEGTPEALIGKLAEHGRLSAANAEYLRGRAAHFSGSRQPVAA